MYNKEKPTAIGDLMLLWAGIKCHLIQETYFEPWGIVGRREFLSIFPGRGKKSQEQQYTYNLTSRARNFFLV